MREIKWRQDPTCKHAGDDSLIVERNNGIRWVTCTDCHTEFVNHAYAAALEDRITELRAAIHAHREELLSFEAYPFYCDDALYAVLEGDTP